MPKISINILTRNRLEFLKTALESISRQSFQDFEVIVINDNSSDETKAFLEELPAEKYRVVNQSVQKGITLNRDEALRMSLGEYIALLDDDDQWLDVNKLKKQLEFLEKNKKAVLVGGGIEVFTQTDKFLKFRPKGDKQIRNCMLFRNNFFTSTVMFRKNAALKAGGFVKDQLDYAEDYDLWLRLGKQGEMHNFSECFALYRHSAYNKEKFKLFLTKQRNLIGIHRQSYPHFLMASLFLKLRILFS